MNTALLMTNGCFWRLIMIRFLLALIVALPISCGLNKATQIEQGKALFHSVHIGKNKVIGCISCHTLKPNVKTVGPSLYSLSLRADKLVAGLTAQQYIKESIINPDAYLVSGYEPAVMFTRYKQELSEAEINAIVAYLLNLK